jgi:hypothetical protein
MKIDLRRLALAAALPAAVLSAPAGAQVPMKYEYAAKVVCGVRSGRNSDLLPPGRYFTIVNIHNPSKRRTHFMRKVAQAGTATPTPISAWETGHLEGDEAVVVQCAQIAKQMEADWVEGFLVVQSAKPVDVVAVYATAASDGGAVNSFHTERVPARPIE